MMSPRQCGHPACAEYVAPQDRWCDEHAEQAALRAAIARAKVLQRDAHQCAVRRPGCAVDAATVVTVRPDGGDGPDNREAACQRCATATARQVVAP